MRTHAHTEKIHTNDLVWWTQTAHTHTHKTMCTVFAPDKALSKDNKLREFSNISESHKSPSLATSSERTADIYIHVTTVKCPVKCCNIGVLSPNGIRRANTLQQPLQCSGSSKEIRSLFTWDVNINTRIITGVIYPSSLSISENNVLIFAACGRDQTRTNAQPRTDSKPSLRDVQKM